MEWQGVVGGVGGWGGLGGGQAFKWLMRAAEQVPAMEQVLAGQNKLSVFLSLSSVFL